MHFLIFIILLLTAPNTFAQDSTTSANIVDEINITASESASPSAQVDSSTSADINTSELSTESSQPENQVIEPDTETIIIYTGIMVLILLAFFAGKKSSELSSHDK